MELVLPRKFRSGRMQIPFLITSSNEHARNGNFSIGVTTVTGRRNGYKASANSTIGITAGTGNFNSTPFKFSS